MGNREELTKSAYDFVLQCYFGDMTNPVNAAINRAYVDMAAHTLQGFGEDHKTKWECRYKATEKIKKALKNKDKMEQKFEKWHTDLCGEIQKVYKDINIDFTYGQAQKWVNMTTKYLVVFYLIFDNLNDKEKQEKVPKFFHNEDNMQKLHIPLDNYLLQHYGKSSFTPWSKMEKPAYDKCREELHKTLEDELKDWIEAANSYRVDDKKSYAYHEKTKKNTNA